MSTLAEDLEKLHVPTETPVPYPLIGALRCKHDGQNWPCATIELVREHKVDLSAVPKYGISLFSTPAPLMDEQLIEQLGEDWTLDTGEPVVDMAFDPVVEPYVVRPHRPPYSGGCCDEHPPIDTTARCTGCKQPLRPLFTDGGPLTCETTGCPGNLAWTTYNRGRVVDPRPRWWHKLLRRNQ